RGGHEWGRAASRRGHARDVDRQPPAYRRSARSIGGALSLRSVAVSRTSLLVLALAGYAAVGLRGPAGSWLRQNHFDPFLPVARALELRVEEGRFAEALPLARGLRQQYPHEPLIAYWLARIHLGLHDTSAEIEAWNAYQRDSSTPEEACPALPEALARAGRTA